MIFAAAISEINGYGFWIILIVVTMIVGYFYKIKYTWILLIAIILVSWLNWKIHNPYYVGYAKSMTPEEVADIAISRDDPSICDLITSGEGFTDQEIDGFKTQCFNHVASIKHVDVCSLRTFIGCKDRFIKNSKN